MINSTLNINKNLKLILPNTNKALELALKSATEEELQTLTKTKDLDSILNSMLKESLKDTNKNQNKALLELLKNNPTLKSLSNAAPTIKKLINLLKQEKIQTPVVKHLENFLSNIKDIEAKELHKKIKKSGVFFENKLKNSTNTKEILNSDLKSILLKSHHELSKDTTNKNSHEILKHIDKLNLQIDYHQLISHLSNSSSLYIPYSWDTLEDGDINIKTLKENHHFCDIHLTLKEYGEINLRLMLFDNNKLNINIDTNSKELKDKILVNINTLKKALKKANLTPKDISFIQKAESKYDINAVTDLNMGFEVKA